MKLSGPQKNVRTPASMETGMRDIAASRYGVMRSQSGASVPNEKSSGMPSTCHGAHTVSNRPSISPPPSSRKYPKLAGSSRTGSAASRAVDRLGDQVVVLGRLERDRHAGPRAELPGPHAGAVDDDLALDVAVRGADPGHRAALGEHVEDRHALEHGRTGLARALGEGHRHVDRVGPAVLGDVEAGEDVVGPRQREQVGDLARRDLVHVDAAHAG